MYHVEIGQGRLDHDDIGAFFEIQFHFPQRFVGIRRVHLVGTAVAELRDRIRGVAKGSVIRRSVLGGIGKDRDMLETLAVEALADRPHAAVHHVRRRYHVGAGAGLRERGPDQETKRGVVLHVALPDHAAVPVIGVFAETHVTDDGEFRSRPLDRADGLLDNAVVRVSAGSVGVLVLRDAEQHDGRDTQVRDFSANLRGQVHRQPVHAGHGIHRRTDAHPRADKHGIGQVVH